MTDVQGVVGVEDVDAGLEPRTHLVWAYTPPAPLPLDVVVYDNAGNELGRAPYNVGACTVTVNAGAAFTWTIEPHKEEP